MKRIVSVLMSIVIVLSCVVFIMPPNIVLAANNADDIVSIARGELGSTNYSKYYGGNKGAWCADFVSWCAQQAGVDSIAKSSSCYNMYIGMKNNGCQEVSSPQKGDIVFFYCTKCSSTAGKWCHVGIMEDSKYSIEGNRWSNGVSKVERGNSYSHNGDLGYKHRDGIVRKYLRPKYSVPNPPTYSNFWIDGNFYDLSETITFNVTASGADRFAIGIDKIGGARVVTEDCGSTYSISANRLGTGSYSAYMSVANSAGYVDTYRVEFTVVEKMTIPTYSNFWIDGNFYDLSGTITFNVTASMADRFAIGIDKIGVGRVVTEGCGSTYSISANRLGTGNYSAYMSVANRAGGVDTYRVEFTIVEKMTIPTYSNFWVDRNLYDLSDTITFNVTASMADRFAIGIDKIGGARVVTEGCGSTYSISAERLGTGNYSAYMSVANSAGGVDTYRVGFIVAEKSKYLDIGTNFIANIIRTDSWSYVVNNNANACIGQEVGNANEYWYFQKQDDGSYAIRSMEDGKYLDVTEAGNSDGLNVYCNDYTGADNQRWFIKQGTNGLILIPKCAINSCLDIANGFTAVGTNAWLWTQNGTAAQEFNVYKEDTIKLGTANVTLSNNNYIYDGKEKKPDVTVKYGYATLQQGTDYTVEYSNNVKAGTATVTIKGTGIYSGTVSKNFEIKEALYTVYGYQVVINGNFDLKYYIDLSKEAANDTDAYIEFKVGDRIQKVKQRETSNGHYVYTCEVPVAQIGDKVTATLYYKDKSYALTQYSVKDYLNTIVQNKDKKEEYGKAADIASAILNYGARAQLYFGYKTDSLVNSALSDAEIKKVDSILAQDIKNAITNKESGVLENNDFKYYGASLVCKSDTGMKLYFENKNSLSLKEIEKKYDISVKDCKKQVSKSINGNVICITINDLNATELDDNFVVQITNKQNSSQSMSVSTSPYIYIKKSMDSGNAKLINLSKAMYWYSQKAMEYTMTENR